MKHTNQTSKKLTSQRGSASLVTTMVLSGAISTILYYNVEQVYKLNTEVSMMMSRERAKQNNLSGLSQASALMAYYGTNPSADDPNALPPIYPEPYFQNGGVARIRTAANAPTWNLNANTIGIKFASTANLKNQDFGKFVTAGTRSPLTQNASITFNSPVMDPNYPLWIRAYQATATFVTNDGRTIKMSGSIPVPPMPKPKCRLLSPDGNVVYQPNAGMNLDLMVAGVAQEALVPTTTNTLTSGDYNRFSRYNITRSAKSIKNMYGKSHSWRVNVPSPPAGAGIVTYTTSAYLKPVDDKPIQQSNCTYAFRVQAPPPPPPPPPPPSGGGGGGGGGCYGGMHGCAGH